jgi:predicted TPR repeat methyltransferase
MRVEHGSSGDLLADRRYAYALASLKEGDAAAAADLLSQTLELVPAWPPAHFALGDALEALNQKTAAAVAFMRALQLAPVDAMGAALRLARLGMQSPAEAMSPGYVTALFDGYAARFDTHLVEALAYRGPQIIREALQAVCAHQARPFQFATALDLGCGTGLMARALEGCAEAIDGVDLSPAMVAKARATGLYRHIAVGDAVAALETPVDLVLAADVLVYIGDLLPLFAAAAHALTPRGLFAFTVQSCAGDKFLLGDDLRYHHGAAYVRRTADAAGLHVAHVSPCVTRQDAGRDVDGLVVVLGRDAHAR